MTHLVMLIAVVTLAATWWVAVRSIPWAYALLVPRRVMFALGAGLLIAAGLAIPLAMQEPRDPENLLPVLAQGWWGSFFLLLPAASMFGRTELEELFAKVGIMLAAATAVLLVSFYMHDSFGQAVLHLWLVLFGAGLVLDLPRLLKLR